MTPEREEAGRDATGPRPADSQPPATENPELADAELQERYRQEYLQQLRRLACPGCGEDFSVF